MDAREVAMGLATRVEGEAVSIRKTLDDLRDTMPSEDRIADYPSDAVRELREALMRLEDVGARVRDVRNRIRKFPRN